MTTHRHCDHCSVCGRSTGRHGTCAICVKWVLQVTMTYSGVAERDAFSSAWRWAA